MPLTAINSQLITSYANNISPKYQEDLVGVAASCARPVHTPFASSNHLVMSTVKLSPVTGGTFSAAVSLIWNSQSVAA